MGTVDLFKALGDDTRIRILNILFRNELCVCEIESILNVAQSNASRHLMKLKTAGIIDFKKKAQWVYYFFSPQFIMQNRQLVDYLETEMAKDSKLKKDLEKLATLKESDFSCGV